MDLTCLRKNIAMQINRRSLILSAALFSIATLPGCAGGNRFSLVEAIRRLLSLSSQRAFAGLLRENGFFDDQIARIDLPPALGGARGTNIVSAVLRSGAVRDRMLRQVNRAAEKGAEIAAPLVVQAIQAFSAEDALSIIRGGGSAATDALKGKMGSALISAMAPGIEQGLRLFDNQIVTQALKLATGIDFAGLRDDVTANVSDAIYRAIAREEQAIRADPRATNDPLLIGVLGLVQ
jgi:Protein of unknown function (DUF4197)